MYEQLGNKTTNELTAIIRDLNGKIAEQERELKYLRSKGKKEQEPFDAYPDCCCEYKYETDEWFIPGLVNNLFNLDSEIKFSSLSSLFDEVRIENRGELINNIDSAVKHSSSFELTVVPVIGDREVKLKIIGNKFYGNNESPRYRLTFKVLHGNGDCNPEKVIKHNLSPESLQNLPIGYFRGDKNKKWVYVNKMWESFFGYTLGQLKGKNYDCNLPEYARNDANGNLDKVLGGEIIETQFSFLTGNNKVEHFKNIIYPLRDDNNAIVGFEGFVQNLTELTEAKESLRVKEEKYSIIKDNIPVVVYSKLPGTTEFKILFISGSVKQLTDYNIDDFFRDESLWKQLIHSEDFDEYQKKIEDQFNKKIQIHLEYRIIARNNEIKWVRDISTPRLNAEGMIVRINGFVEDISDRKKAERALTISEKKFRSLFEESEDCIYMSSADGQIIDINRAGLNLLGFSRKEILMFNATNLYVDIADRFRFKRLLEENNYVKDFEVKLKRKDGEERDCLITSTASKYENGEIKGYQGIIRDITEKKKSERELIAAKEEAEKADRIKTEFLAQMSHEIRTPINTILSFSSLIRDEINELLGEDSREYFSILDRAGIRIIRTIDLILNMSEMQSGSYNYKLTQFDLSAILIDLYTEYKPRANDKGLNLKLSLHMPKINIMGDEYSVTQIASNLIDNAIKYTDKGHITIEAEKSNSVTKLAILDSGIGISPKYIPYLFDAFTQEEQGYTRKFEGSGLGLALVKKYCEINNAAISVESIKGKGSKFLVNFNNNF
jgi:PAS domain S-box-containing protein